MNDRAPVLVEVLSEQRSSGPGARLQAARLERGLEIGAIAASLRVAPRLIMALEGDDFAAFDAPVYARGFLRTYASFLGLPVAEVLATYDAIAGGQPAPSLIPPASAGPFPRDYSALKYVAAFVVAIVLVGASYWWWLARSPTPTPAAPASVAEPTASTGEATPAGLVAADGEGDGLSPDSVALTGAPDPLAALAARTEPAVPAPALATSVPRTAAPAAAPVPAAAPAVAAPRVAPVAAKAVAPPASAALPAAAAHPAPMTPPPAAAASRAAPVAAKSAPASSAVPAATAAATHPAPVPAPPAAAAPRAAPVAAKSVPPAVSVPASMSLASPPANAAVAGDGPELLMRASKDCWVEVRGANGSRIFYDLVRAGQTRSVRGAAPWRVFLGFVDGIELTVDGHTIDVPPAHRQAGKARFGLNADGSVHY